MKVCGKKNWGLIDQMLGMLEQAQEEGIRISFDQYPYVAGSTMLGVILPPGFTPVVRTNYLSVSPRPNCAPK